MKKGVISQRFDLGTMALRPVSEAKGIEEIEEKAAKVVFDLGWVPLWKGFCQSDRISCIKGP